MKKAFKALTLLLALALFLGLAPALAEEATQTPAPETEDTAQVTEEAGQPAADEPAEETAGPGQEPAGGDLLLTAPVTPSPEPFATMAPLDNKDMPKPGADKLDEATLKNPAGAALFELPSHESAVLLDVPSGATVSLLVLGQSWSKVGYQGQEGYLPTYELAFTDGETQPGIAIATAPNGKLTLRAEMTTKSKALDSMESGRAALLLARGKTFSLVRFEGREGYVLSAYLLEVPVSRNLGLLTPVVSIVADREANVRVRAEASRNAVEYTRVRSGQAVVVLGIEDDWAQVEYEGFHGYMMAEYLKKFD